MDDWLLGENGKWCRVQSLVAFQYQGFLYSKGCGTTALFVPWHPLVAVVAKESGMRQWRQTQDVLTTVQKSDGLVCNVILEGNVLLILADHLLSPGLGPVIPRIVASGEEPLVPARRCDGLPGCFKDVTPELWAAWGRGYMEFEQGAVRDVDTERMCIDPSYLCETSTYSTVEKTCAPYSFTGYIHIFNSQSPAPGSYIKAVMFSKRLPALHMAGNEATCLAVSTGAAQQACAAAALKADCVAAAAALKVSTVVAQQVCAGTALQADCNATATVLKMYTVGAQLVCAAAALKAALLLMLSKQVLQQWPFRWQTPLPRWAC